MKQPVYSHGATVLEDNLTKQANLAADVIAALERDEPLTQVILKARRLADLVGDRSKVIWLSLEAAGLDGIGTRPAGGWSDDEVLGFEIFFRTRAFAQPPEDFQRFIRRGGQTDLRSERKNIMTAGLSMLEALTAPDRPTPPVSREALDAYAKALHGAGEVRRILQLIRTALHTWATGLVASIDSERRLITRFGKDAPVVFAADGTILSDLRSASEVLDRPGGSATAGLLARNAILEMGRRLYTGPATHVSPVDGKTHLVKQEKNQLHAFLDQLWASAEGDKRKRIDEARGALEDAYDLGSKAKNPTALTFDEAEGAVRLTYQVAHAICFAGGFPSE